MSLELYRKYLLKLQNSCVTIRNITQQIELTTKLSTEEEIDARIQACDKLIVYLHEAKRWLLYFKNQRATRDLPRQ